MKFIGLKPWSSDMPFGLIEGDDSNISYDIHGEWLLARTIIENSGTKSNIEFLFHYWEDSTKAFSLKFSDVNSLSIFAEFGAADGPYDNVDEISYGEQEGLAYIEVFGAMRRMQFTCTEISLLGQ